MTARVAFGDESGGHSNEDPGVFLLTACVLDESAAVAARATMEALRPSPNTKLHWREELDRRNRRKIVNTVVALPCEFHVVVRVAASDRPERRRAKALEKLLIELEAIGVAHLTLESRTTHQDQLDRNVIDGLRARRLIKLIRIDHAVGKMEPLVWVGDVVCGIVADHRIGTPGTFYDELQPKLVEHSTS